MCALICLAAPKFYLSQDFSLRGPDSALSFREGWWALSPAQAFADPYPLTPASAALSYRRGTIVGNSLGDSLQKSPSKAGQHSPAPCASPAGALQVGREPRRTTSAPHGPLSRARPERRTNQKKNRPGHEGLAGLAAATLGAEAAPLAVSQPAASPPTVRVLAHHPTAADEPAAWMAAKGRDMR